MDKRSSATLTHSHEGAERVAYKIGKDERRGKMIAIDVRPI